jgi:phosphoribosylglycinamide formyltransferase-1
MRIVGETLLRAFDGKILNIHPALLPSFKGAKAIDDAFNFGVKVFGATVHLIDGTIDGGTVIAQRAFEYYGNSRDEVEQKIHEIEHQLFPEAINLILKKMSNFAGKNK